MFADTLLDSSPRSRKRKRWPMAAAFTVETFIAAILVIVPLLSTGVIPLSARVQVSVPLQPIHIERAKPVSDDSPKSGTAAPARRQEIVLVSNNQNRLTWGRSEPTTTDPNQARSGDPNGDPSIDRNDALPNLGSSGNSNVTLAPKRVPVSYLSEAQLLNRVEPVYPKIALAGGVQGEVKLHAIIARDGRIISLNVTSGHPLLAQAARDAVLQWRYRPYYLNGQPVEVETFITVNFKKGMQ